MKLWTVLLLIPLLALCACRTSSDTTPPYTEFSDSIPSKPIAPSTTVSYEEWVENITNALSTIQPLYDKMLSSTSQDGVPANTVKKATEVKEKYGKRIEEIAALSLTDLSEEELKEISFELSEIMSAIREVTDLF